MISNRLAEARGIREVKKLGSELQAAVLGHGKRTLNRQINVALVWSS